MLVFGQMFLVSDQYIMDALDINPAFAGCYDALSTSIFYKNQWVGFKDAPKSYILSVHTPLNHSKVGLGLLVERNSIGIYKETNILANYAYRMKFENGRLALGLGLGVTLSNYAWNELVANDPADAALINNPTSAVLPAISMGAYYYTKKYYIGLSMPFFLSQKMDQSGGEVTIKNDFSLYNYFINGGYNIEFADQIKLQPSILIKYNPTNGAGVDFNTYINLKDRIWFGIGYQSKNMIVGSFQCQINYQIKMAYSYIYEISPIAKYTNGSHEITLNYQFKYQRKVMGPRQF